MRRLNAHLVTACASCLLSCAICVPCSATMPSPTATSDVSFLNCSETRVTALRVRRISTAVTTTIVAETTGSVSSFHGALAEGLYAMSARSGKCFGSATVALLGGRSRDVTIAGRSPIAPKPSGDLTVLGHDILASNTHYGLAGRLPVIGVAADLVDDCGTIYPVAVDGQAYYVDSLPPGRYALEVRAGNFGVRVTLAISQVNELTIRDISLDEIKTDRWVELPHGAQCR